jgi:hypothetical protein
LFTYLLREYGDELMEWLDRALEERETKKRQVAEDEHKRAEKEIADTLAAAGKRGTKRVA